MKLPLNLLILLVAALAVALLADAWHSARRDSQKLAATLAAQNQVIQQAADQEKQRDTQLASALAAIQSQKQTIKTPQQAAAIPSVLPPLPLPVSITVPNLSAPSPSGEPPPANISIPQPDLLPLYDNLQDCRATALQNGALQKDLSDEKTRSAALERERDAAKVAARGGPILQRVRRAAKWFLIGAAVGAAAVASRRH
jgi:hypothetical protein